MQADNLESIRSKLRQSEVIDVDGIRVEIEAPSYRAVTEILKKDEGREDKKASQMEFSVDLLRICLSGDAKELTDEELEMLLQRAVIAKSPLAEKIRSLCGLKKITDEEREELEVPLQ